MINVREWSHSIFGAGLYGREEITNFSVTKAPKREYKNVDKSAKKVVSNTKIGVGKHKILISKKYTPAPISYLMTIPLGDVIYYDRGLRK